jgi:lipoprotein NlpD
VNGHRKSRLKRGASAAAWLCALFVCLATLASCTSTMTSLPVSRREARAAVHVVQPGETLSKIAWQYRVDQQEIANWNGIRDPNQLRVGQRLRLVPPRGYVAAAPVTAARPPADTVATPARTTAPRTSAPTPARTTAPRPSTSTATAPPRTTPPPPAARPSASPPARAGTAPRPAPAAAPPARWAWPTDGRIVTRFGTDVAIGSGIGIGGREGQPVRAAAAGRVVYAGGGLIGYGQLVIIKHDETFLSAYGYNAELLVTQGQDVARGATIALMGQGPGRQPGLHFEIRRNGVPVDPLLFVSAPR